LLPEDKENNGGALAGVDHHPDYKAAGSVAVIVDVGVPMYRCCDILWFTLAPAVK
jgi:hypothetical protein